MVAVSNGDIVEILGDSGMWYGEVVDTSDANEISVNYISKFQGDVWRFDKNAYMAPRASINFVAVVGKKACDSNIERAWKEMGFVYRGDHEIIKSDDVDSETEDEDYEPDDDGGDDQDDEESEDEACSDSEDEAVENDDDIADSDIANSDDEDEEDESDDEDEDEDEDEKEQAKGPAKKRAKTKS